MGRIKVYNLRGKLLYSYYPNRLARAIDMFMSAATRMGIVLIAYVLLLSAGVM